MYHLLICYVYLSIKCLLLSVYREIGLFYESLSEKYSFYAEFYKKVDDLTTQGKDWFYLIQVTTGTDDD